MEGGSVGCSVGGILVASLTCGAALTRKARVEKKRPLRSRMAVKCRSRQKIALSLMNKSVPFL